MKRKNSRFQRRPRQVNRSLIFRPKRPCPFKSTGVRQIDYKDLSLLSYYVGDEWKILPGRMNNISAAMQRQMQTAIKRARFLSLMPYTPHHSQISKQRDTRGE